MSLICGLYVACCYRVLSTEARAAGIQIWDRWRTRRAQAGAAAGAAPWEGKGGLLYHIELGLDLVIRVL